MNKEKSTAFMKGAISLSVSVIITKILGVAFKVPLSYILGDEGMGYFNTAYAIYGFFYILCTAGVPKSLMLVLSGSNNLSSKEANEDFILKSGLTLFFKIGLIATLLNITCAPALARFVGNKKAMLSILAVAPSVLFVSLSGVLRGYLNSKEKLMPIAISQLLEAFIKLALGLLLSFIGVKSSASVSTISALAILGITMGSGISFAYMMIVIFSKKQGVNCKQKAQVNKKTVNRCILKNALPIALSSSLLNLSSTLDLTIIIKQLVKNGMTDVYANSIYGNYTTLAVPMFMLVISVLSPLATSYMPRLSSMNFRGEKKEFSIHLNRLLLITILISVPASLSFYFYSFDLLDVLFSSQSSAVGAELLICLSMGLCVLASLTVVNTALESQGRIAVTVISLLFGSLTKFIVSYVLVGRAEIGILGAPLGTVISYTVSLAISLFALEISGVKTHTLVKVLAVYIVGILSFYPPYKFIYTTGVARLPIISMGLSLALSCLSYVIILAVAFILLSNFNLLKCTKKSIQDYMKRRKLKVDK